MPFDSLPDALLGRILGLVGASEGASLTLVSRRWRPLAGLFYSEPSLWQNFTLAPARPEAACAAALAARHALLHRVAPLVRRLDVQEFCLEANGSLVDRWNLTDSGLPLGRILGPLHADRLTSLMLCVSEVPPAALEQATRFSRLRHLAMQAAELPPDMQAALHQLRQLRSLALCSTRLPAPALAAVAQEATFT
ncbi:hypothetical protein ABPG75_009451 [Micractinium tetrahymenae]